MSPPRASWQGERRRAWKKILTPVSARRLRESQAEELRLPEAIIPSKQAKQRASPSSLSTADDALEILKSQPDYDVLISVLRFLTDDGGFRLQAPTPKSASILHALVTEITPNFWPLLRDDSAAGASQSAELFLTCLRSISGLNGVISCAKFLIRKSKLSSKGLKRSDILLNLDTVLDMLASLLAGYDSIQNLWQSSVTKTADAAIQKAQSQQLVMLISNGAIISTAAEAFSVLGKKEIGLDIGWIADGIQFSRWIGCNLSTWAKAQIPQDAVEFYRSIFQRSLSLGYSGNLVRSIIDELLLSKYEESDSFIKLCFHAPQVTKKVMNILLEHLSRRFLEGLDLDDQKPNDTVAAVAGLINTVVGDNEICKAYLVSWCISSCGAGLGLSIGIRRAVLAVLAKEREAVFTVLEKSLTQFGEEIYIRHTPILQQYVHTQILLLSAGYVARQAPIKLKMLLRSSTYLNAITNRIATTQTRARFLGMVVGECLSALADDKSTRLNFRMEEMETGETEWLKRLGTISDGIGPSNSILSAESSISATSSFAPLVTGSKSRPKVKPISRPTDATSTPKAIIEEISSSDDEELLPYAKGSDPEDSDDDATLVQRNKLKPPVYIRDLIAYLRDSENYDKQKLALQSAPVLIHRKASFGTEVSSHADELARLLVGLHDKFNIDDFAEKRQQGMIALVVAQPKTMAPWFARTFFEGDYSLAQRTSVLVTLGLSARELAGYEASEHQAAASFPSRRLPEKVRQLFIDPSQPPGEPPSSRLKALPPTALETISRSLTSSFLGPLAAQAADATAGPDVLKLQTFTQRYKSSARTRPRVRAIPNTTAALLATSFFSPLTAHFQKALRSARPIVLNPALLSLYLQTLGIVVSSAGPATLALPQLTSELWDLLLRIRVHVLDHLAALSGWLVALTVLIDVHDRDMRSLCRDHGRELLETREWVTGVFERTRGDDNGEENDVKMLAAGALIKLGEIIDNYQALLMGNLLEFG